MTEQLPGDSDRLSVGLKAGWAAGAAGTTAMLFTVNFMLLFFMVTHLGISPALAGLLIFITRFYDMLTDPLMGVLSDRVETRIGRRRPWMFAGAILSSVTVIALFNIPDGFETNNRTFYMAVVLILFFTGYTLFSVPFTTMAAEMTDDYHERTSLMSYRTLFANVGSIAGAAGAPALIGWLGSTQAAYGRTAWILSAVVFVALMSSVASTARAPYTRRTQVRFTVTDYIKTALSNRPYLLLMAIKLVQLSAVSAITTSSFFFVTDVLQRDETLLGGLALIFNIASIASLPLWVRLGKRWPKQTMFLIAALGLGGGALLWLTVGADSPIFLLLLPPIVTGVFHTGTSLMGLAMLPDTIEWDTRRTGIHREGIFTGLFTFVEKTAFALGPLVMGILLSAMGYVESTGEDIVQTPSALRAVYIGMGVIPAVVCFITVPLIRRYDLTEEKLKSAGAPG